MATDAFEVFGLGQCSLDYISVVHSYPPPDTKCEFSDMVIQGGGPVATALVALARWNISCSFTGVLGDDAFGSTIKDSLDKEGIDTRNILFRKGYTSQFAFIVTEPGIGRRTIFWKRPSGPPPLPHELNYDMIEKAQVLHTDGLFIEASLAACQAAKKTGVHIVVDAGSFRQGMLDLAKISDYFIASETFANAFAGEGNAVDACHRLSKLGPRLVAVTLGARGYVALAGEKIIMRPAYPVDAVDTTGCGDVFHAGFVYGLIRGWKAEESLDFAAWAAAMVSLRPGGRAGIPSPGNWHKTKPANSLL